MSAYRQVSATSLSPCSPRGRGCRVGRTAAMSDKPVSGIPSRGSNGAAAGAFLAGFEVLPQPSVNPAPSGSPTHVTRDRDPRGDSSVAPLDRSEEHTSELQSL